MGSSCARRITMTTTTATTMALSAVMFGLLCMVEHANAFTSTFSSPSLSLVPSFTSTKRSKDSLLSVEERSRRSSPSSSTTSTTPVASTLQMSSDNKDIISEEKDQQQNNNDEKNDSLEYKFEPVFDFTKGEDETPPPSLPGVNAFERIDDAIMGGISTSSLRQGSSSFSPTKKESNNNHNDDSSSRTAYGIWSGVCRIDGGGFCGTRTLPFTNPLNVGNATGFYMDCALVSDDEPHRRVWKMVTRTDTSRGEQVYQASFTLPTSTTTNEDNNQDNNTTIESIFAKKNQRQEWTRIKVPFQSFQQVRGPRLVENGPPLNVTGGLYQFGLSMSKFQIASNTTELPNFRPGYFELHIQQIGLYEPSVSSTSTDQDDDNTSTSRTKDGVTTTPNEQRQEENTSQTTKSTTTTEVTTLSAEEAKQKRPLLFKLLTPIVKLFFSEQSNRRRSVMRILKEERGYTRIGAIMYGIRSRINPQKKVTSTIRSIGKTLSILMIDSFRTLAKGMIRFGLLYPIKLIRQIIRLPFLVIRKLK